MINNVIYLVLSLFLLLIINNLIIEKKSKNLIRHRDGDSKYAHFSEIDKEDYFKYPKLMLASPKKYILNSGDTLVIPAKWWHWVKTPIRTYSINFWTNKKISEKPFKSKHYNNIDFSVLDNEMVNVWTTEDDSKIYRTEFRNFLQKNEKNEYIITLENYDIFKSNKVIKEKLKDQIIPPDIITNTDYEYNIWITSNQSDTGLHYDDHDGVLCCLEGKKEIILYPPSDSKYLYPLLTRKWVNSTALNFRYNSYTFISYISGLSSGRLLFELTRENENVLKIIDKFVSENGINKTVWGLKKHGELFRLEFYTYDLETSNDLVIVSKDVFFTKPYIGEEDHYYYKLPNQKVSLPFWGFGKKKLKNIEMQESKIFLIDSYENFKNNYEEYMKRLDYNSISKYFRNTILEKYKCYEICIFNKTPGQIFVMYLGISKLDFIKFLLKSNYPKNLIKYYLTNKYEINNEIAIIYDIKTKKIIRSGFYGIV